MFKRLPYGTPLVDRFWAKVNKDGPIPAYRPELGPCWLWTAAVKQGTIGRRRRPLLPYGICSIGTGQSTTAHRVAWELEVGPIPAGLCVLHRCDNPICVRPAHLFLGTRAENCTDRRTKGRDRHPQGVDHPEAKLTDAIVRDMRRRFTQGETQTALGYEYGVSQTTVSRITLHKAWTHVT